MSIDSSELLLGMEEEELIELFTEIENEEPLIQQEPTLATSTLVTQLKQEQSEVLKEVLPKLSQESFRAGVNLSGSIFSALGSLISACGPLCAHTLGNVAQMSSNISSLGNMGGMPGLSFGKDGSINLKTDLDSLSKATGLSQKEILSGKHSTQQLFQLLLNRLGFGMECLFGFSIIGSIIDLMLPGRRLEAA